MEYTESNTYVTKLPFRDTFKLVAQVTKEPLAHMVVFPGAENQLFYVQPILVSGLIDARNSRLLFLHHLEKMGYTLQHVKGWR